MERHMLRERPFSCPISSSGARECQRLHPLASRIIRDDLTPLIGCLSLTWLDSDWTDSLQLTAWFSYHVVSFRLHTSSTGLPRFTDMPLFTNHNVTACQRTRGHQEWTQNPCQQSLYNPCLLSRSHVQHSWSVSYLFSTLSLLFIFPVLPYKKE